MMRFGSLLITFLLLSWIQFSEQNSEYLEVWKPEVNFKFIFFYFRFTEKCDTLLFQVRRSLRLTFYHLQKDIVQFSDYDVLHDADTDTSRSTQDHGGVIFHICLKPDYATVTRVFFNIFANLTAAKIM